MPFKKGKSGNPAGYSKDEAKFRSELKQALMKKAGGPEGLAKKLWEFVEFASEHNVKLAAMKEVLDRIFGKPSQQVEVEGGAEPIRFIIETGVPDPEGKPDARRKD